SFNTVKDALLDTFTFGFWGPANSGLDVIKSIILSILSMFAPILVLTIVVALLFVTYVTIKRFKKSRQPSYIQRKAVCLIYTLNVLTNLKFLGKLYSFCCFCVMVPQAIRSPASPAG